MTKYDEVRFRWTLDRELTFAFRKNEWLIAWGLICFAKEVELISEIEFKWLRESIDCLGTGEDSRMRISERNRLRKVLDQELGFAYLTDDKKTAWGMISYAKAAGVITEEETMKLNRAADCLS